MVSTLVVVYASLAAGVTLVFIILIIRSLVLQRRYKHIFKGRRITCHEVCEGIPREASAISNWNPNLIKVTPFQS